MAGILFGLFFNVTPRWSLRLLTEKLTLNIVTRCSSWLSSLASELTFKSCFDHLLCQRDLQFIGVLESVSECRRTPMSVRKQLHFQVAWQVFPGGLVDLLSGQVCRCDVNCYPSPIDGFSLNSWKKNLQPLLAVLLLRSMGQKWSCSAGRCDICLFSVFLHAFLAVIIIY